MRPDEHKHKKNAQYKKKHGITDKNKDGKGQKDVKGQGQKDGKGSKPKLPPKISPQDQTKRKEIESTESSDSSDNDKTTSSKPSFQRRKVVSNWDRYNLPPDEELTKTKGEDFSKLLQAAGSSTSQFRFKEEEEEWASHDQSDILSLDVQDLSASIDCVPLYKVLRLNEDLFSTEQIKEYDRQSSENQRIYQSKHGSVLTSYKDNIPQISSHCDNKGDKSGDKVNLDQLSSLDELLDSVVLEPRSDGMENMSPVINQSEEQTALENDLDNILSADSNVEVKKPNVQSEGINTVSKEKPQDEDLEDWLDSVLDS